MRLYFTKKCGRGRKARSRAGRVFQDRRLCIKARCLVVVKSGRWREKLFELEVGVVEIKVPERRGYELLELVHTQSQSLDRRRHRAVERQAGSYFAASP